MMKPSPALLAVLLRRTGNECPACDEALSEAESMELLAIGGVGRLVYTSWYGPVALPVQYIVYEGSVVVRAWATSTEEDLRTGIAHAEYVVAVEADQVDLETREGWFVLVRGAAHHLDTEAERAPIIDAALAPWTEEEPEHFIRVNPTGIWGNASAGHDAAHQSRAVPCC